MYTNKKLTDLNFNFDDLGENYDNHHKHHRRNQIALGTRVVGMVAGTLSCKQISYSRINLKEKEHDKETN